MKKNTPATSTGKTKAKTFAASSAKDKQEQRVLAAMSPSLAGHRAEYFVSQWDKTKGFRPQLLMAFCLLHGNSNSNQVDQDLGDAAPLFFTRITSWFRLSYKLFPEKKPKDKEEPTVLLWMVKSLAIFLKGTSYITLLCESGMNAALIDCLDSEEPEGGGPALCSNDRLEIVLLLLFIANSGRVYREMVCDEEGLAQLLHCLQREDEPEVTSRCIDLLVVLALGNPRLSPMVETALWRVVYFHRPGMAAKVLDAKPTRAEDTVLQVVRAAREMQMTKESQFYLNAPDGGIQCSQLPIVGLPSLTGGTVPSFPDPLLEEMSSEEYLDSIMYLNLHNTNTSFRVEGSEMLALVAKNTLLTARILNQCFDIMDDDMLRIADEDDATLIAVRQRHQLSCGRAVVEIILSKPMTEDRWTIILNLIGMRSAHITLLKYLRMSDGGDVAAVVDCCRALQLILRAADRQEHHPAESPPNLVSLQKVKQLLHDAVGDSIFQILLFQDITEEESFTIMRVARSTAGASAASLAGQ